MIRPILCSVAVLGLTMALTPNSSTLPPLLGEFKADERSLTTAFGLPWSELHNQRQGQSLDAWGARLDALPFETLGHEDQVDWLLFKNALKAQKNGYAQETRELAEMDSLLPFRKTVQTLESNRIKRESLNPQDAAAALAPLVDLLEKQKKELEKQEPKPSATLALRAAGATEEILGSLESWFAFYDSFQPDFGWWVRQPYGKVKEAMQAHAKFLREEIAQQKGKPEDPLVGDPIGAAALAADIETQLLANSAEELIAVGEREFAWCVEQLNLVATAMGTDAKGAIAKVKAAHVPPGEQDNLVAAEAQRAIDFLKKHELVTIPPLCEETWRMRMISPEGQKTMPYAVYSAPAVMVAYAADTMPHEDKLMAMRGNNKHFTRIVTPHELIPGHHLQRFVADRNRPWRAQFNTPFYVEGWALYWEMLLWDKGYADSPEDKAGMLFWRMHRCARIIVSLKFHLGQMQPAEMVDFLVEKVGHEKSGATGEVRRYIGGNYGPLYQAGYMLGGLQIRALYKELVESGKLTAKAFHDAVLEQNTMPPTMLRAALTKEPLTRDWKPTWRFGG